MSFDQRFQITGRIAGSLGQIDHALSAREIATGRSVTIHLLAGGRNAANDSLLSEIGTLPAEYQVCFVETGDQNGTLYVITDTLAGNRPLREWMSALKTRLAAEKAANPHDATVVRAWKTPANFGAPGQAPQQPETSILGQRQQPPVAPAPVAHATAPTAAPPVAPGGPDQDEFSRLLSNLDPPRQQAGPPSVVAPAPPPAPQAEPGEFTRLLRAQQAPSAPPTPPVAAPIAPPPVVAAPPPAPAPQAEPGEFTRLLRAQQAPAAPPPMPAPAAAPAPPPAAAPVVTPAALASLGAGRVHATSSSATSTAANSRASAAGGRDCADCVVRCPCRATANRGPANLLAFCERKRRPRHRRQPGPRCLSKLRGTLFPPRLRLRDQASLHVSCKPSPSRPLKDRLHLLRLRSLGNLPA